MAIYRNIHVGFWSDPFVLELTPEEKYFFLYLMTNPKTLQCGVYELPYSLIQFETGYNIETVEKLIKKFINYGKIKYDKKTKEIMIINWLKYNYSKSPKVLNCIRKEIKSVKSHTLRKEFDRVSIQYGYSIDMLSQEEEEEEKEKEEEKKIKKKKYAENVTLAEDEFKKLVAKYGEKNTKSMVEKLNFYKGSSGKKYKSDYMAILNWVADEIMKKTANKVLELNT